VIWLLAHCFAKFSLLFLENSTMKMKLIPILLVLALAAGCTSKSNNGTADTTSGGTKSSGAHRSSTGVGGQPAMTLTPPSVAGGKAGPITVMAPANTRVLISAVFFGTDPTQKVTIWSGTPGQTGAALLQTLPFSTNWASFVTPNNATDSQTFTITDSIASAPYPNVGSSPVASGTNTQGFDITTYSATPASNRSVVAVLDLCGQF
jgi:hypothetical protein